MIADMQTEIEAARGDVLRGVVEGCASYESGRQALPRQALCQRDGDRVVYKAVQVHGSAGVLAGDGCGADVPGMRGYHAFMRVRRGAGMIIARELLQ